MCSCAPWQAKLGVHCTRPLSGLSPRAAPDASRSQVRCQAGGLSSGQVVRDLFKSGAAPSVLRQLYSGVMSASLCSAVIGALYYASFCACKRAAHSAADAIEKRQQQQRPMAAATTAAAAAAVPHHLPHGLPVGHHHDAVMATICYDEATTAAAASTSAAAGGSAAIAASPSAASGACCAVDAADVAPVAAQEGSGASNGGLRLAANLAASVAAGLMGGLVEGPLELFKHQAQAGQISGSLFSHMAGTVQSRGLGALYVSFVPFLLKSLPFDCSELVTYSSLQDMRDRELAAPLPPPGAAAAGSATQLNAAVRAVPDHVWDCAIGATAGAAAVIISHPFDVVKTVMETGGSAAAAGTGAGAFAATARNVVAKQGPGGLWVGIVPRMAEVPSTMVYWLAVEGCRRLLEPHTAK